MVVFLGSTPSLNRERGGVDTVEGKRGRSSETKSEGDLISPEAPAAFSVSSESPAEPEEAEEATLSSAGMYVQVVEV